MLRKRNILAAIIICCGFLTAHYLFNLFTTQKTNLKQPSKTSPTVKPAITKTQNTPTVAPPITPRPPENKISQPQEQIQVKKELPSLILSGILLSQNGNVALINNRILKEGDDISGAKISKIYSDKVELDFFGDKITLRIK